MAFGIFSRSPEPIRCAIHTLAPTAKPAERLTNNATISPFVPTAASASGLPNFPAIAVSAELKSY